MSPPWREGPRRERPFSRGPFKGRCPAAVGREPASGREGECPLPPTPPRRRPGPSQGLSPPFTRQLLLIQLASRGGRTRSAAPPQAPEKWSRPGPPQCLEPPGSYWSCCSAGASGAAGHSDLGSGRFRRISKEVQERNGL